LQPICAVCYAYFTSLSNEKKIFWMLKFSGATEHWFGSQARVDRDVISSFIKLYYNQNLNGIHVVLDGAKHTLDNCFKKGQHD
jgi:uncharacterized protein (DUF924 family)